MSTIKETLERIDFGGNKEINLAELLADFRKNPLSQEEINFIATNPKEAEKQAKNALAECGYTLQDGAMDCLHDFAIYAPKNLTGKATIKPNNR